MPRRSLLICGILSTLVYLAIEALGALSYPGYDYAAQTISEMSAVEAPTRSILAPFYLAYTLLLIAFAVGVRTAVERRSGIRVAGNLLLGVGVVGLVLHFFPMQMRGQAPAFTDAMHVALGGINSLLLLAAIGFAANAFGRRFRAYSIATMIVMMAFGAWTFLLAPDLAANRPTPYLGIVERVLFASFLIWIAVLSGRLLSADRGDRRRSGHAAEPASSISIITRS